ncbi:MAG: gamma-glutamyltransferase, partial [Gammaproteobacteria bacterium]
MLSLCLLAATPVAAISPAAAAIASAHPFATRAGMEVLQDGGNAFDAAVTVSAVLAVVEPYSSGLGGGGFWLLHRAADSKQVMIDGRERAPLAAHRDLYLDERGDVIPRLSLDGPLAAGVPGEPAALAHLAKHYGRLPLTRTLAAAIRYAKHGFPVERRYRDRVRSRLQTLQRFSASAATFLFKGDIPPDGHMIRQPALALVLEKLAVHGHDGFYHGEIAHKLVEQVRDAGGIWTLKDLADYRVVEREPVRGDYRGIRVTAAAPPSSGGIGLVTMLNILHGYAMDRLDPGTRTHLIIEAMRRAYRDRAQYLGDPDFVTIPLQQLIHPWYGAGLRASIRMDRATPSARLPGFQSQAEGTDTTHFSILDREGNRVAATLSINY